MSRTNSIPGYPFSEADLKLACKAYVEKAWRSAEACPELDFEPSAAHRAAIRRMMEKSEESSNRRGFIRRLAVAAAIVLVVVGLLFAIHANAGSEWKSWLMRILPDRVQYFFYGQPSQPFYEYETGWLPEGVRLTEHNREEDVETMTFTDNDGFVTILISCYPMNSWDEIQVTGGEVSEIDIAFGIFEGTVYFDRSDDTAFAILFDEVHQMLIELSSCNVNDEDVMSILRAISPLE